MVPEQFIEGEGVRCGPRAVIEGRGEGRGGGGG